MKKNIDAKNENIIGNLIMRARGSRSLRQYAEDAGVSFTTVSKIENGEYIPSPKMIRKLISPEAKPQNGISYEDVMNAAGFKTSKDEEMVSEAASEIAKQIVSENFSDIIVKDNELGDMLIERKPINTNSTRHLKVYSHLLDNERSKQIELVKGLIYTNLNSRGLSFKNIPLLDNDSLLCSNFELLLSIKIGKIENWRLNFRLINAKNRYRVTESMVLGRILSLYTDESLKFSFVTDDLAFFSRLAKRAHMVPYRGELSVILVNMEEMKVEKEIYLSNYYENDDSSEFFLA